MGAAAWGVLCATFGESPGPATRTEMLMVQLVHCVTDATWSGGGVASSQLHFQLITTVVVSGPSSDRSSGGGSSLQFHVQFQTMILGDVGAGSAVIPFELLPVVLPLESVLGCEDGDAPADGVETSVVEGSTGAGSGATAGGGVGTAGDTGGGTAGTTVVCATSGGVGGTGAAAVGSGGAGIPPSPHAAGAAARPTTTASAQKQTRWGRSGRTDITIREI